MQRSRMTQPNSNTYYESYTDDDSGISLDYDYSSTSDIHSSRTTLIEPPTPIQSKNISYRIPDIIQTKEINRKPLMTFTTDGIIERIRPITLKNSQNGDYIICNTNRGTYIAYRTPVVPAWVTQIVREVELREK
ncbi:unnamed protein product [Adineta steineri]|uniref:Uncharacterized protein n=1 Tax=Adineta steineri TaxID=433720 RepID=A0A814JWT2_9BILA|nr:unnamed protein product [Adineta steineri]